jgi:5,10-methylenetetrahydromethanopterin reductase
MGRNESVNEVGELARLAEDCGLEHVTLVDEPFLARDVFTGLAVVAMNTDRVSIGHGVVDPLTYFPTALGNAAATLNELSGGRAFLGLGAGGPAGKFMEPLPFRHFEEAVLFLKRFMRGEQAEYRGHAIHSEWIKDPVPLWLAADGPRSLKLAGRLADGVITMGGSPTLLKWKLGMVAQGAEEAGRDPSEIDVWVRSILIVAESKPAAFREAASFLPGVGAVRNYVRFRHRGYREEVDRILEALDREQPGIVDEMVKIQEAFEPYAFEQLDNPPSRIASQRVVDFFNQTGTEDEVCEGIERLGEAGVKCIATATYTIIDKKAHLRAVGERIIPRFRD